MRVMFFGLMAAMAICGAAQAQGCDGQGSEKPLVLRSWTMSSEGKTQVAVDYRLNDEKAVTLLQAHLYFQIAGTVVADGQLNLVNSAVVARNGVAQLTIPKDAARRLATVDHASVTILACTNSIEYRDGSGLIID